ncbi:MAG: Do family serine endopeptidase [Isosphaeraceae bacterium]
MTYVNNGNVIRIAITAVLLSLPHGTTPRVRGQEPIPGGSAESLSASFRDAARKVLPAVVTVRPIGVARVVRGFGPGFRVHPAPAPASDPFVSIAPLPPMDGFPPGETGGGSGVIIDAEKGYVLTNDHVTQGATEVVVVLPDGRERPVTQIRRDSRSDLALLVIDPKGLTSASWGDSEALETGDWVLAIGRPVGLSGTLAAGIVSGRPRAVGTVYPENLIQTDAAIHPGNSGGPLVNLKGQIVGINSALKASRMGLEGMGFAMPASRARRVAADLAEHGRVRRAFLGVSIGPVRDRSTADRLEQPGAVEVLSVSEGSPAERAGLKKGDRLVALNSKPIESLGMLQNAIELATPGEPLTLSVDRPGQRLRDVEVRPEAQPESPEPTSPRFPADFGTQRPAHPLPPPPRRRHPRGEAPFPPPEAGPLGESSAFPELGLRVIAPSEDVLRRYHLPRSAQGLVIVGVEPDGPADRGGFEVGTLLIDAGGQPLNSVDDLRNALAKRQDRPLICRVQRGAKREFRVLVDPATDEGAQSIEPEGPRTTLPHSPEPEKASER